MSWGFMGKKWDSTGIAYDVSVWVECLRVLKPGGHVLAFGGSWTFHRMAVAIEDAGFEIRDSIAWMYGSGFPKSLDVSKAIDKRRDDSKEAAKVAKYLLSYNKFETLSGFRQHLNIKIIGEEHSGGSAQGWTTVSPNTVTKARVPKWEQWLELKELLGLGEEMDAEVWRLNGRKGTPGEAWENRVVTGIHTASAAHQVWMANYSDHVALPPKEMKNAAHTAEAQQWEGWGTALKPAFEPIVVGRKPFAKGSTVAANVLLWGVGGLNIDASRVEAKDQAVLDAAVKRMSGNSVEGALNMAGKSTIQPVSAQGRWPANVILDEYSAGLLDEQSGVTASKTQGRGQSFGMFGERGETEDTVRGHTDSGGASRFFYCAKASKRDRNEGVNLCKCDKLTAWENAEPKASHQPDTDHLAPRVISESGTTSNTDTGWNTSSSGKSTTAPSSETTKSTTLTGISSTTTSGTSLTSTPLATNVFTRDVNSEMENGGSPARFAKISSQSEPNIGISAERAGFSTGDADPATSASLSSPNKSGEKLCANCGGVTVGHPTVKPTALMRYLIKLVTPPGGTVLDPFTGSGSTGKAALLDGYNFVGAEFTEEYLPIIEGRLRWAYEQEADDETLF